MTAAAIAEFLHARPCGRGRWTAHCPGHSDDSPSLGVTSSRDGRVLIRCRAGCSAENVIEATGLRMADLFAGPLPTPEQLRQAAQQREHRIAHRQ